MLVLSFCSNFNPNILRFDLFAFSLNREIIIAQRIIIARSQSASIRTIMIHTK